MTRVWQLERMFVCRHPWVKKINEAEFSSNFLGPNAKCYLVQIRVKQVVVHLVGKEQRNSLDLDGLSVPLASCGDV